MGKPAQIVTGMIAIGAGFAVDLMYNFITGTIGPSQSVIDLGMVVTGARWLFFGIGAILIFYALVTSLFGGRQQEEYRRPPPEEGRREPRERREPERKEQERREQQSRDEERPQEGPQREDTGGPGYTDRLNQARRQQDER